jgi:four helix bundle protein
MRPEDLRQRTRRFTLDVVALFRRLPRQTEFQEAGRQLRRAANGVSSNYRAAGRGRSRAEFIAKLGTVLEEADESHHWLDLLAQMALVDDELPRLVQEADELVRIFSATCRTAKRRSRHAAHAGEAHTSPDRKIR